MRKINIFLILLFIICSFLSAQSIQEEITIDRNNTSKNFFKLTLMSAVPATLFLVRPSLRYEFQNTVLMAGIVTAIPILTGYTLVTIELIKYNKYKKEKETQLSILHRF